MADPATKHSPLATLTVPDRLTGGTADVSLTERPFLGKLVLRGGDGIHDAVRPVLGLDLPAPLRSAASGRLQVLWQGPDSWLIVGERETVGYTEEALRVAASGLHAAVTDVSSGTTVLRLAGPAARDVLLKGCGIDLEPPAFGTGSCTPTRVAAFAVTLVQIDDAPTYDLYIARSLARTFAEWLIDACGE